MHRITTIVLIILGVLHAYTAIQIPGSAGRGEEKRHLPTLQETHSQGMECRTPSPGTGSRDPYSGGNPLRNHRTESLGGPFFGRNFNSAPVFHPKGCEIHEITAYSNHVSSTGKRQGDPGYGITASGRPTKEGRTIATDTALIPFGSILWIDGIGIRVAEDTGGDIKGNRLDVYMEKEEDCWDFGRQNRAVVVLYRAGK